MIWPGGIPLARVMIVIQEWFMGTRIHLRFLDWIGRLIGMARRWLTRWHPLSRLVIIGHGFTTCRRRIIRGSTILSVFGKVMVPLEMRRIPSLGVMVAAGMFFSRNMSRVMMRVV